MRKYISVNAFGIDVTPWGTRIIVDLALENEELISLLDDMEIDNIISFLKDKGYNVTKNDNG